MNELQTPGIRRAMGRLEALESVLVAVSGGVDSAVLLALAVRALGPERVLGVTAVSAAVPLEERRVARRVAAFVGAPFEEVDTKELENPLYSANRGDRCYHCRNSMFEALERLARARGFRALAYGAIVDDLGDHRPGMRAARELGVHAPLLDAGLTKAEVREIARGLDLPVSEKPAAACLSSRIPVGTAVTAERLARVERAEDGLRRLGFGQFRVRYHGDVGRLELDPEGNRRLADPVVREQVVQAVRDAGFRFVALDLEGYRTPERPTTRPSR